MSRNRQLAMAALCIALAIVLPRLAMGSQVLGTMFLPMHFPILLCAFLCDWKFSALSGAIVPLIASLLFGMPPLYPVAVAMCFELCTYGLTAALLYKRFNIYASLLGAMLAGRLVYGAVQVVLSGIQGVAYAMETYLTTTFLEGVPGILLQLLLIPVIVLALDRAGILAPKEAANG
ncbi:MAG: ECF transporter S component [Clostridiales bacterium]|nr:ECF transporter S component [Clostridiales bacterium]